MNARRRVAKRRNWPANLYQKPDGYFYYRNLGPGKMKGKIKGLGRDRAKAFDEAITANLALASKKANTLVEWIEGVGSKTLKQCADEFEANYIRDHESVNSVKQTQSGLRRICMEPFADKPIHTVTTNEIYEYIKATETSREPSAAAQRRILLLDIFNLAESQGLIPHGHNPVTITKAPKRMVKRDRLSLEQFLAIRAHAKSWLVNAMNLALATEQAREEMASAKFTDVRDGFWYFERLKTKAKIRISLSIQLKAVGLALEDVVKQCRDDVVSVYMIHLRPVDLRRGDRRSKAGRKVELSTISKAFSVARDEPGVTASSGKTPPTFHEIRSLAARLYHEEYGGDFAQKLLGHKSPEMTALYRDVRGSEWIDVAVR